MTGAKCKRVGTERQRGFWLRCFLERALFAIAVWVLASGASWARVEAAGPLHLWRIHGVFVDAAGKPLENVEVTLVRDGEARYRTKTDNAGKFQFDHVSGRYWLHIDRADYSPLSREVIVGEAATLLHGNTLYVIAGPGACTDDCSSVFTSKSEFDKAIRRNTRRF